MNEKEAPDPRLFQAVELRHEAEERLGNKKARAAQSMAEADTRALVHELQVHQIELELQNEELQRAHLAAAEASEKYFDLFDFAPIGYFLWDAEGRILEVNLAGAALLGLGRSEAIQRRFSQFVAMEDRVAFADFCKRVLATDTKQTGEVKLFRDGQAVYMLIEGIAAQDSQGQRQFCRAAVIDITQQRRADELAAANQALQSEIAARSRAEEQLKMLNETLELRAAQLRALASEMTLTEHRERRRLAQVLHDHLQQMLVAAKMQVTIASRKAKADGVPQSLRQIDELLDQSIAESRSLTVELSPPVLFDRGLVGGLEWLARRFLDKHQLPITLELDAEAEPADEGTRIFLFQAAREMLFNTVKHAQAQSARICLSRLDGDRLRLVVLDDGQGFDPSIMQIASTSGGFGLFSIRERLEVVGGRLEVISAPGRGTQMVIEVFGGRPVPPAESLPVPGKPPTR